jgi:glycosyltransferase involved in cell wall biosynthesis
MSKIKLSIVVSVWATEHLMKRSIETWANQDFPKEEWELIVVNDCALGNVKGIIEPYRDKINIQYIEFDHKAGMRGGTIPYNVAWMCSAGEYIAESTPETMWTNDFIRGLYEVHEGRDDTYVIFKTYNLTSDMQLKIDTVDWKKDVMNISKLEGWDSDYVQRNFKAGGDFGSHQSSSIKKKTWFDITNNLQFPLYNDYGSCDPFYLGLRKEKGIQDLVVTHPLLIHQHHLPWQYFASLGHSPLTNKDNHSIMNVWNDISGRVPEGGTSSIWNGDDKTQMSEEEKKDWRKWNDYFLKSGGDPKYLEPKFDYYKKCCYYL